ncbi:MAG TPA: FtsQ-type POTRA domain-containing protein [Gaiellaceae bacterium]|nr:FtsQ-type POTRA domain-containing protein [Gaiellaceae bacterium]
MPARPRFARSSLARSIARVEALAPGRRPSLPELRLRERLAQIAPTRRSLALGFGILTVALGGYLAARETSLFAIQRIEVEGASPQVAAQVRRSLAFVVGRPLVGLDGTAVLRKVDALPTVVRASYDRAFPHTLRILVVAERPAAVLRSGTGGWLVSARGRVVERLPASALPRLPRIWIPTRTRIRVGAELGTTGAAVAARAVGLAGAFAARVASASYTKDGLVFRLRSGFQLLLGDGSDVKLKVAVAERVLTMLPYGATFLDVSIPGRPVAGTGSAAVTATTKLK